MVGEIPGYTSKQALDNRRSTMATYEELMRSSNIIGYKAVCPKCKKEHRVSTIIEMALEQLAKDVQDPIACRCENGNIPC